MQGLGRLPFGSLPGRVERGQRRDDANGQRPSRQYIYPNSQIEPITHQSNQWAELAHVHSSIKGHPINADSSIVGAYRPTQHAAGQRAQQPDHHPLQQEQHHGLPPL